MRFLIVGLGSIGARHLKNLVTLGYKDVILCRTGKSKMPDIDSFGHLPAYYDLDEALAQKPDVVMVTNPTALHVPVAIKAARAGCHLFIEKPVSCSLEGLDELSEIVRKKRLITFMACQFRFHPHIAQIKNWLTEKKLGRVFSAHAQWSEYLPDWHPWEDYKQGYSARKDLGGGVAITQIHPVDYLYWLFGGISHSCGATASTGVLGIDVDDVASLILIFKSKIIGTVQVDYLQKPRVHTLNIAAQNGRVEWDCHKNRLAIVKPDGTEELYPIPQEFERNTMFVSELRHFVECVEHKKETLIPLQEGIEVLESVLTARVIKAGV